VTIPAGTLVPREARDFGSYELIAKLATGGMAEIFLARRARGDDDELVVLKRILPHLAEDEHFVTMFRDEARLASRLEHANVGKVHALGHVGATWFIVMEYLHGVPLSRMLTRLARARQFLDVRLVAAIICQACEGLHHAHELTGTDGHELGVVHRDVSPPNIFVTGDGVVKLLDFGIAKARGASSKTRTGTVKGKNAYMSPEQILGKPLDRRSDVFALGAVMYELLAVKRLFHRESDFLTFKAITEEPIPDVRDRRPDLPQALRAVVTRALSRDPAGRFDTALEMSQAVRAAVSVVGGPATTAELTAFVKADFGDELAAKQELVEAAELGEASGTSPLAQAVLNASSSMEMAKTTIRPRGRTSGGRDTEELDAIDGEVEILADDDATRQLQPSRRSASMIIAGTPAPTPTPPPIPGALGTAPIPRVGTPSPATFAAPTPAAGAMTELADPSTDLLREWRKKRVRNVAVGGVALGLFVVVVGVIVVAGAGGGSKARPAPVVAAAPHPDAPAAAVKMPAEAPIDGGVSRDDIIALSKYGFFSVDASAKTVIFIDGNRVGEAPITRLPLQPGIYKVKAIGPHSKVKRFEITIYATKDTDHGTITW
jgi:serine/threonine protein kinase